LRAYRLLHEILAEDIRNGGFAALNRFSYLLRALYYGKEYGEKNDKENDDKRGGVSVLFYGIHGYSLSSAIVSG
jgi:hypothetical protein